MKITAVTNVVGRNLKRIRFSPGGRHDIHLLESGPWLKNRLIVFDLGFFKVGIFKEIDAAGGYFLSRLKKQSNPVILKPHTKELKNTVGMKLKDVQTLAVRGAVDAEVLMSYIIKPLKHLHSHREGAFGKGAPMPFVGYFFLLEDNPTVWRQSREQSLHFPVLPPFKGGVLYSKRYEILCEMLVQEKIYTAASVIRAIPGRRARTGELSEGTSVKRFVATLAGHVATAVSGCLLLFLATTARAKALVRKTLNDEDVPSAIAEKLVDGWIISADFLLHPLEARERILKRHVAKKSWFERRIVLQSSTPWWYPKDRCLE